MSFSFFVWISFPQVSQQNENNMMDATFEFFNSPSNSSASSVCDDEEDNKNVSNDSDTSAESPVPHSEPRYKHSKVCQMFHRAKRNLIFHLIQMKYSL